MVKGVTHAHLGPIWYHLKPLDVPYSPNQFLALEFFSRISTKPNFDVHLQQSKSHRELEQMEPKQYTLIYRISKFRDFEPTLGTLSCSGDLYSISIWTPTFYSCLPSTYFAVLTTEVGTKLGGFKTTILYSIVAQFCELEGPRLLESDQNKNLVTRPII